MSLTVNENLLSAQESYFVGQFGDSADKLKALLVNEQLESRDNLRIKQNIEVAMYASAVTTARASLSDEEVHVDAAGFLLHQLEKYVWLANNHSSENQEGISSVYLPKDQPDVLLSPVTPESLVVLLNIASLRYERHQYDSCRIICESLAAFLAVERQDNGIIVRVYFLLIEVLLRQWSDSAASCMPQQSVTFQNRAFETLDSAELCIGNLTDDIAASSADGTNRRNSSTAASVLDLSELMEALMTYRLKLYSCRINIASGSTAAAKEVVTSAMNLYKTSIHPAFGAGVNFTDTSKIHHFCTALSSYFGMITFALPLDVNALRQCLRSQLYLGLSLQSEVNLKLGNPEDSLYSLNSVFKERSSANPSTAKNYECHNNRVVVYLTQKRYHLACLFSQKAVEDLKCKVLTPEAEKQKDKGDTVEETAKEIPYNGLLPHRCTAEVLYNSAVSLLLSGNNLGALLYFEQIIPDLGSSPMLWIRMSECCVHHHAEQLRKRETGQFLSIVGPTGRGRRLQFREHVDDGFDSGDGDNSKDSHTSSSCSLSRAVQYLSKAIALIRDIRNKSAQLSSESGRGGDGTSSDFDASSGNAGPGSVAPCRVDCLESAAVLQLAYVHLELNSPLCAWTSVRDILQLPRLSNVSPRTRFLAETYACEALCALGRVEEALTLLQPQHTAALDASSSSASTSAPLISESNVPSYYFTDNAVPTCIKSHDRPEVSSVEGTNIHSGISYQELVSTVNFATALAMQGNLLKAQSVLESVRGQCPTFIPAVKLLSCLLLRKGQHGEALSILKYSHSSSENRS